MNKHLSAILFLVIFSKFASAATDDHPLSTVEHRPQLGSYGLEAGKEVIFLQAQQEYMFILNARCSYPTGNTLRLPLEIFELQVIPEDPSRQLSAWIKGGVNVTQALDSLADGGKHELDCTIAIALSQLAGIRRVIGDDARFNQLCNSLRGGINKPTELTNFYQADARITKQLQKPVEYGTPGSVAYLEQVPFEGSMKRFFQLDAFGITRRDDRKTQENAIGGLIKKLCGAQEFSGNFFVLKHQYSNWQGINVLLSSSGKGLFFEEGFLEFMNLSDIALRLIREMDANLSTTEQALFITSPHLATALNGITYVLSQQETLRMTAQRAGLAVVSLTEEGAPSVTKVILERAAQHCTIIDFTRVNKILVGIDAKRKQIEENLMRARTNNHD